MANLFGDLDTSGHAAYSKPWLFNCYDQAMGSRWTADSSGTLDSVKYAVYDSGAASQVKFCLYTYIGGTDSTVVDSTAYVSISAHGAQIVKANFIHAGTAAIVAGRVYQILARSNEDSVLALRMGRAASVGPEINRYYWYWSGIGGGAWQNPLNAPWDTASGASFIPSEIYYTTESSPGADTTPPGNHASFTIERVVSVDPDTFEITIGNEPAAADYDTTSIRFGTTAPTTQGTGSSFWQGGQIADTTFKVALTVGNGNWVYVKIFAGDTVSTANWSTGVLDSIYVPANGNECPSCSISPFKQSISGLCYVQSISGAGRVHRR